MSEQKKLTTNIEWINFNDIRPESSGNFLIVLYDGSINIDFYDAKKLNNFATYDSVVLWSYIPVIKDIADECQKKLQAEYASFLKNVKTPHGMMDEDFVFSVPNELEFDSADHPRVSISSPENIVRNSAHPGFVFIDPVP